MMILLFVLGLACMIIGIVFFFAKRGAGDEATIVANNTLQ